MSTTMAGAGAATGAGFSPSLPPIATLTTSNSLSHQTHHFPKVEAHKRSLWEQAPAQILSLALQPGLTVVEPCLILGVVPLVQHVQFEHELVGDAVVLPLLLGSTEFELFFVL